MNRTLFLTAAGTLLATTIHAAYPLLVDDAGIVAPAETEVVMLYEDAFLGAGIGPSFGTDSPDFVATSGVMFVF